MKSSPKAKIISDLSQEIIIPMKAAGLPELDQLIVLRAIQNSNPVKKQVI